MLVERASRDDTIPSAVQPGAWGALALLTAMTTFNQIDRRVASLVIEPLKHEFLLTDAQLGMLTGLAFGMIYAVTSIPLGLFDLHGYMQSGSISVVLAGIVLSIIPVLIIYSFGQRYLIEGLMAGGLKG